MREVRKKEGREGGKERGKERLTNGRGEGGREECREGREGVDEGHTLLTSKTATSKPRVTTAKKTGYGGVSLG